MQHSEEADLSIFLTQKDLANRWICSERKLQRWRSTGGGPTYIRLGGSIRYRLSDIIAFEMSDLGN